jgi:hypothetical protein
MLNTPDMSKIDTDLHHCIDSFFRADAISFPITLSLHIVVRPAVGVFLLESSSWKYNKTHKDTENFLSLDIYESKVQTLKFE